MKSLRGAIRSGDAAGAVALLRPALSAIDRAVAKGVLTRNAANRYKSRLSLACNAMRQSA
jgi:ribosomal protein S20